MSDTTLPKRQTAADVRDAERGWTGRISASLIGSLLLSFALGVACSIYLPGSSGLDQAFAGGLILALAWPVFMLWILFARSGWRAWGRVLIGFLGLVALDIAGLLL